MTNESSSPDTIGGNKIIAEFMGWENYPGTDTYKFPNLYPAFNIDDPENTGWISETIERANFHSSWDWLMPVYRKTAEIGLWMMCNGHDALWLEKSKEIDTAILTDDTPARAATLIAQLIQWYNTQSK